MAIQNWSDEVTVVELAEEPMFTEEINSVMDALGQKPADVLLNFAAVGFVNSSNLARLLRLRKMVLAHKRRLIFSNLSMQVATVFAVTGLDKIFEFTSDISTALAMLQMGSASSGAPATARANGTGAKSKNSSGKRH